MGIRHFLEFTTHLLTYRVNGPAAVLFTYLTELHGPKYRAHVLMVVGWITQITLLMLPLLAWAIFPRKWDFLVFNSLESKRSAKSFRDFCTDMLYYSSQLADLSTCVCPTLSDQWSRTTLPARES